MGFENVDGVQAIACSQRSIAGPSQNAHRQLTYHWFVLGHENRLSAAERSLLLRSVFFFDVAPGSGQIHFERRAKLRLAQDLDRALVLLNRAVDHGKSQTCT